MTDELTYRIITLLLLMVMKTIRWRTKIKFSQAEKQAKYFPDGLDTVMLYSLGISWSLSVVVYALAPEWIAWARLDLPDWLRWAGIAMGMAALVLLAWSDHCLGKNFRHILRIRSQHDLVRSGPSRWIRHPIYSSGVLFFIAMLLTTSDWMVGLCWSGVLFLYMHRVPREESMMLEAFGDNYWSFMKTTGRLLPKLDRRRRA